MTTLVYDCDALTVLHHTKGKDGKQVFEVIGYDRGEFMSLQEMCDFGKAMVQFIESNNGVNVSCN